MDVTQRDELYRIIGERVRARRDALEMTQEELATRIGVTRTSITNLERGRQKPPVHVLAHIAEVLDVELRDFLPARRDLVPPPRVPFTVNGVERNVTPATKKLVEQLLDGDGKEAHEHQDRGEAGAGSARAPRRRASAR